MQKLQFVSKGPIKNKSSSVPNMAWHPGDKPLSEPVMIYLTDAYMRHSTSMS